MSLLPLDGINAGPPHVPNGIAVQHLLISCLLAINQQLHHAVWKMGAWEHASTMAKSTKHAIPYEYR